VITKLVVWGLVGLGVWAVVADPAGSAATVRVVAVVAARGVVAAGSQISAFAADLAAGSHR
jgi:hypothetical protein